MVVGAGAPGLAVWFGLGGLLCGGGGATAGSARTRSRDQGRWSIKSNSLKEDIEGRKPAKTLAGPVVDQIKDPVKLRL